MTSNQIRLSKQMAGSSNEKLLDDGAFRVLLKRSQEGVEILSVQSDRVELEILPFQGQQIWRAIIDGRDLTMKSLVTIPVATNDYLRNYGAFLVHCGATAMGGPSSKDSHSLHGELPNAIYNEAWLVRKTDENGSEILEIHGKYLHQVAMTGAYDAHPVITLNQASNTVKVTMSITNTANTEMELMYMAHVNFLPVDDSKIVATHHWNPSSMRVIKELPAHVAEHSKPEFMDFLKRASVEPEISSVIEKGKFFDPELVAEVDYFGDEDGFGHTLIVHPDGTSDYLGQEISSLPLGIRYIQRTSNHDCIGTGPSTSGVTGKNSEKNKGTVKYLGANETYVANLIFGALNKEETAQISAHIGKVVGGHV